ncbi:hypothetical protein CARUB_v10028614mg [Capsella rubella]|uniref:C2H2-type domain-containing protein n=1 Tax=Capsella rubella TaxID=81985 RepID=R0G7H6_9BRAS|nr:zinc finger protein ZAT9 [Capsella rubella]EOA12449.1 hypothetical protein CARUB_v10028614mg [Capsella rubella]
MYPLLNQEKTCQVCKKSFSNGKALGGHMKSHTRQFSAELSTGSSLPSLRPRNNLGANFRRPHETVLMRSALTNEAASGRTPDLTKEGEQEVTAAKGKIFIDLEEEISTESLCGITSEQNALCLLQMKTMWSGQNPKSTKEGKDTEEYMEIDSEEDVEDSDDEYVAEEQEDNEDGDVKFLTSDVGYLTADSDEYADENAYYGTKERRGKKQSKYMCDICGKVLRSHQALGGHRTSHRNKRLKISGEDGSVVVGKRYECQICNRVFESGQALGGHKKVHYAFLSPINFSTSAK